MEYLLSFESVENQAVFWGWVNLFEFGACLRTCLIHSHKFHSPMLEGLSHLLSPPLKVQCPGKPTVIFWSHEMTIIFYSFLKRPEQQNTIQSVIFEVARGQYQYYLQLSIWKVFTTQKVDSVFGQFSELKVAELQPWCMSIVIQYYGILEQVSINFTSLALNR